MSKRWRGFCIACFAGGVTLGIAIGAPSMLTLICAITSLMCIPLGYWILREHDRIDQYIWNLRKLALMTGGRRGT